MILRHALILIKRKSKILGLLKIGGKGDAHRKGFVLSRHGKYAFLAAQGGYNSRCCCGISQKLRHGQLAAVLHGAKEAILSPVKPGDAPQEAEILPLLHYAFSRQKLPTKNRILLRTNLIQVYGFSCFAGNFFVSIYKSAKYVESLS